jgi:hypothetical protein
MWLEKPDFHNRGSMTRGYGNQALRVKLVFDGTQNDAAHITCHA